jgi:hypothetical protein
MFNGIDSDYMVDGEALDGETILRLRPSIEQHVAESVGDFKYTELFWNLKDENNPGGVWVYQLHFFKEDPRLNDNSEKTS